MSEYRGYGGKGTLTFRKLYGYKRLIVWQAADDLAAAVHDVVRPFRPPYYGLASQMLRSASSVKANLAEGYCRNALGDYVRFCEIARGSLGELGSQLQDCERWRLTTEEQQTELLRLFGDTTYFLEQLLKQLYQQRKGDKWNRDLTTLRESSAKYADIPDDYELPRAPTSSHELPRAPTCSPNAHV